MRHQVTFQRHLLPPVSGRTLITSEKSINFHQTTRRNTENSQLRNRGCEDVKSQTIILCGESVRGEKGVRADRWLERQISVEAAVSVDEIPVL